LNNNKPQPLTPNPTPPPRLSQKLHFNLNHFSKQSVLFNRSTPFSFLLFTFYFLLFSCFQSLSKEMLNLHMMGINCVDPGRGTCNPKPQTSCRLFGLYFIAQAETSFVCSNQKRD